MSPTQTATPSKTLGFVTLFLIEMWERFGYYGMTAVVVLYMIQRLGYGDRNANLTFGAFTALAYAVPAVGGWIGDRVLGSKRTAIMGALILAVGYTMMSLPLPVLLFPALAVVAVGGGIFKSNPANVISKLYQGEPAKLDSAFTMYYMAVNLGATISQILTPLIGQYGRDWVPWVAKNVFSSSVTPEQAVDIGWHAAFGLCAFGLVLGLISYFFMRKHLSHVGSEPDAQPLNRRKFYLVLLSVAMSIVLVCFILQNKLIALGLVVAAALAMLGIFYVMIDKGTPRERKGLIAVLVLTLQTILFFIFYQQMSTSLTLFAARNVDLNFYGYLVPAGQVQALNPIWIFLLSPPLAWLYNHWSKGKGDFHISTKFAAGFAILSLGFFIYGASGMFAVDGKVSMWWMVWGYCLQSLGELLISGLGLAMVSRYVGPKLRGFIMGTWFLATGISQYLGGFVANYASVPDKLADLVKKFPAQVQDQFKSVPAGLLNSIQNLTLEDFRSWLDGEKVQGMQPLAATSADTQKLLHQLDTQFYVQTLPLYTNLFIWLGVVALIGTIIAIAIVPSMRRLSAGGEATEH
ncbi:MAG: peptide MFS transporter [Bacillota bacterium]